VCVLCDEVVELVLSSRCHNERKRGEGLGSRSGSKMLSYIREPSRSRVWGVCVAVKLDSAKRAAQGGVRLASQDEDARDSGV
jgi:hypothetical protein